MGSKKQSTMMEHTLQELCGRNNKAFLQKPYVLALLTSHMIGMEPGLSYMKKLNEQNITLRIVAEEAVLNQYSKDDLVKLTLNDDWIPHHKLNESIIHNVDTLFLPILSFSLVSDILSFNENRPAVRLILAALLSGKKVMGLRAGADPFHPIWKIQGMDKGEAYLKRRLIDKLHELKLFGIKLINENEWADFNGTELKKTIVTEEMVRYAHQKSLPSLFIMKDSVITPLARDTAKELNIELILQ